MDYLKNIKKITDEDFNYYINDARERWLKDEIKNRKMLLAMMDSIVEKLKEFNCEYIKEKINSIITYKISYLNKENINNTITIKIDEINNLLITKNNTIVKTYNYYDFDSEKKYLQTVFIHEIFILLGIDV